MKIAVMGWRGNPERAASMLDEKVPCAYIGEPRGNVKGYDVVLLFGFNPVNLLKLLTCEGVKVVRICGSDWYKPRYGVFGRNIAEIIAILGGVKVMYASPELKKEAGIKGEYLPLPINEEMFYDMGLERPHSFCYYLPEGKEDTYGPPDPKLLEDKNALILDGSIHYEAMPYVYNRCKKYIRYATHDALPKMPYEALLCGCEVWVNGEQVSYVPEWMRKRVMIPIWVKYLKELIK